MKIMFLTGLALLIFLAACTPYMYGVPQETWDRMSEAERIRTMGVYEREQQARRQAEAEQARRQAFEREREKARQAAAERARQEKVESIHRGEGAYGELLRVRLQGGDIAVGDRRHRYEPITFTIADGETLDIGLAGRKGREAALRIAYAGGALSFEGVSFRYDRSWGRGRLYTNTGTSGALMMRGVDVFIEVHHRSTRHEREVPRLTIIREEPPHPAVIRERDVVRPSPMVVTERNPPRPPQHQSGPPAVERPPHTLEVVLLSGEMKVRGRNQKVERGVLRLVEGETRSLAMKAGGETGVMSLRYQNGVLFINDSPGRGRDVVRLPFEKEWRTGKIYRFDVKKRIHLDKIEVRVTAIEDR